MNDVYAIQFPGVYTEEEQSALEQCRQQFEKLPRGAVLQTRQAKETDLIRMGKVRAPFQPLYWDPTYGARTRWRGMVSFPALLEPWFYFPQLPRSFGSRAFQANYGGELFYYRPVRPGDKLTVVKERQRLWDATPEDGSMVRQFRLEGETLQYNQNGELVCRSKTKGGNGFLQLQDKTASSGPMEETEWRKKVPSAPVMSEKDWERIYSLWEGEEQAAQTPGWSGVEVGSELVPVCSGPVTVVELIRQHGIDVVEQPSFQERRSQFRDLPKNGFGMFADPSDKHFDAQGYPQGRAVFFSTTARNYILRMLTRFMGDAGALQRIRWYNNSFFPELWRPGLGAEAMARVPGMEGRFCEESGYAGDTCVCRGVVTKKYENDDAHCVDLTCWAERLSGEIIQVVEATILFPE